MFALLQTEATDLPDRADEFAFVFGEMGLSAVFNECQVVPFCDVNESVHVTRVASQVDDQNRFRSWRNQLLSAFRVNVARLRVNVGKNRDATFFQDGRDRPDVGDGRSDDFIAGVKLQSSDGKVDGSSARSASDGEADAVSLGEGFLKGFHLFAAPSEKPSTFNDLPQLLKFVFTDLPLLRQRSFPDRLTAVNCQPFRHRTSPHFEFSDWRMAISD
jgi:hypothetical protein